MLDLFGKRLGDSAVQRQLPGEPLKSITALCLRYLGGRERRRECRISSLTSAHYGPRTHLLMETGGSEF